MNRGPASKIITLGLEEVVVQARAEALSLDAIVARCNWHLATRHDAADPDPPETVSKSTVKRYLESLGPGTVAAAHEPTVAAENARVGIEFAERLGALDEKVRKWLDEADAAVTPMKGVLWDPYLQQPVEPKHAQENASQMRKSLEDLAFLAPDALKNVDEWISPVLVMVVDWHARKVAASELRGLLKNYADLMQRIHDAELVAAFQESVTDAIREASPEVAAAVIAKLRERQSFRRAAIFGAG